MDRGADSLAGATRERRERTKRRDRRWGKRMDGTKEREGEKETRKQEEAEPGETTGAWPMPALPQFPAGLCRSSCLPGFPSQQFSLNSLSWLESVFYFLRAKQNIQINKNWMEVALS